MLHVCVLLVVVECVCACMVEQSLIKPKFQVKIVLFVCQSDGPALCGKSLYSCTAIVLSTSRILLSFPFFSSRCLRLLLLLNFGKVCVKFLCHSLTDSSWIRIFQIYHV